MVAPPQRLQYTASVTGLRTTVSRRPRSVILPRLLHEHDAAGPQRKSPYSTLLSIPRAAELTSYLSTERRFTLQFPRRTGSGIGQGAPVRVAVKQFNQKNVKTGVHVGKGPRALGGVLTLNVPTNGLAAP
ncbi:hypothetical protein G7K_1415-t1 [Saitoella complicata NRRL Y-17804]|uniref:Uncharacterized protein n=1 Tax=Saitoella complicata (strain BCRC 22490 / CBS 7301 / JCM 7358 / NBRC 10748 / NRRL Y-17804) TaxID=698492 RepID=A0A0E9NCR1_SAICN|nr:hypothetical protein G7K_1415-t1 [Saitoella complicata NRRL Y-17804]